MSLTFTDIFCAAGGSSIGLATAGLELRLAANHWDRAVETHSTNFPDADHLVADGSNYDMRRLPHTDALWASPECTWHSPAGGRKQAKKIRAQLDMFDEHVPNAAGVRSRATAFDVIRAAEVHRHKVIIVENVCEFADREMFDWWLAGLRKTLDYTVQLISVSSAHIGDAGNSPAPQWRDRLYLPRRRACRSLTCDPARRRGAPPATRWSPPCSPGVTPARRQVGKYRQQYDYRCPNQTCRYSILEPYVLPAAAAIDCADLGSRIGDRAKPLADATIRRIQAGLAMFSQPAMIAVNHDGDGRAYLAADLPLAARTTKIGDGIAWPPFMVYGYSGGIERRVKPIHDPLGTLVANGRDHHGLCIPPMLVPAGGTWNDSATPLDDPMRTRTTRDAEAVVAPEAFLSMLRNHATATSISDPLATLTTSGGGAGHHALTIPPGAFIQKHHGGLDYGPIQHMTKTVGEPLPGLVARPNLSLVIPYRRGEAKTTGAPLLTLGTRDSAALVDPTGMDVDDCHFRMLRPSEHARGQRFPDSYRITRQPRRADHASRKRRVFQRFPMARRDHRPGAVVTADLCQAVAAALDAAGLVASVDGDSFGAAGCYIALNYDAGLPEVWELEAEADLDAVVAALADVHADPRPAPQGLS